MRVVINYSLICGLAVAMLAVAAGGSIAAPKKKPAAGNRCDQSACVQRCIKAGGQLRFCPQYCDKQIRESPKCK